MKLADPCDLSRQPVTPKRLRPRCGAKCADDSPCQAAVSWDKARNRAASERCYYHGGWRALRRLNQGPPRPKPDRVEIMPGAVVGGDE